jgi:hypothetical protein
LDWLAPDFAEQLTSFYARYLAVTENGGLSEIKGLGISGDYAAGFAEFISRLSAHGESQEVVKVKGQVTGPFTMGINLQDREGRSSYYNEQLRDVIVKTVSIKAIWQMIQLDPFGHPVMVFLDEPSLLGFGSQGFLTIGREDVVGDLNEVVAAIHSRNGLSGVHCEENTDWSLLMETELDILSFDAYDHMRPMTFYPDELHAFFDRGGCLGWGIVPTLDREAAATETIPSLVARFEDGMHRLIRKGFDQNVLLRRALITPSCGAGGVLTEALAERVLGLLRGVSLALRHRYGFGD